MEISQYLAPDTDILEKRVKGLDIPGSHLWVMMAGWYVTAPDKITDTDTVKVMDRENLIMFGGPMCFKCEQMYSARMAKRTCHGRLDH